MVTINIDKDAEVAPYGILGQGSRVLREGDGHWVNGFDTWSTSCAAKTVIEAICDSTVTAEVTQSGGALSVGYLPFDVKTSFECSTMGMTPEEIEAIAKDRIEACAQKAIEFELWHGELASQTEKTDASGNVTQKNKWLASPDAVDVTPSPGTGIKIKLAVALLEEAIAATGCGNTGVIHMPPIVASVYGVSDQDGVLRTKLGNKIIVGTGYDGSGPDGNVPAGLTNYIYATGPVTVILGDTATSSQNNRNHSVNISNNTVEVFADMPAAVVWDSCVHYAALVDLSLDFD